MEKQKPVQIKQSGGDNHVYVPTCLGFLQEAFGEN